MSHPQTTELAWYSTTRTPGSDDRETDIHVCTPCAPPPCVPDPVRGSNILWERQKHKTKASGGEAYSMSMQTVFLGG